MGGCIECGAPSATTAIDWAKERFTRAKSMAYCDSCGDALLERWIANMAAERARARMRV